MPKISSRRHFLATTALLAVSAILPTFAHTSPTKGQNQTNLKKMIKNIVLVHGTFVDDSCYAELIRHLQEAGINAVAVQNPLTSLVAAFCNADKCKDKSGHLLMISKSKGLANWLIEIADLI